MPVDNPGDKVRLPSWTAVPATSEAPVIVRRAGDYRMTGTVAAQLELERPSTGSARTESPRQVIEDALTSAYGPRMPEAKVLRQVAAGMSGRILHWLEDHGYQIVERVA